MRVGANEGTEVWIETEGGACIENISVPLVGEGCFAQSAEFGGRLITKKATNAEGPPSFCFGYHMLPQERQVTPCVDQTNTVSLCVKKRLSCQSRPI